MDISFKLILRDQEKIREVSKDNADCILYYNDNTMVVEAYPKDRYKRICSVAIKISDIASRYIATINSDDTDTLRLRQYGQYHILPDTINPGRSQIKIFDNNSQIWEGTVLIIPSNLTIAQFERMLNDILTFKVELLYAVGSEKNRNKISLHKERSYRGLKDDLLRLCKALDKISRNPHKVGRITPIVTAANNVKIFNQNIIRQYIENPWRQSYEINKLVENTTTYENAIIFHMLCKLNNDIARIIRRYDEKKQNYYKSYEAKKQYLIENKFGKDISDCVQKGENETIFWQKKISHHIDKLKNVQSMICNALKLKIFSGMKHTSNKHMKLRLTQIFSNDANYQAIYKVLKKINSYQLEASLTTEDNMTFIEKTPTLYEYWILLKVIEYLSNVGFQCERNISEILDAIWENKKSKTKVEQKIIFCKDDITLLLFYDTPLSLSFAYLKKQRAINRSTKGDLRPDFLFIVQDKEDESADDCIEKIFILDAKYRNYEDMMPLNYTEVVSYWHDTDIKKIAKEKYIDRIHNEYGIDVSMSFIVHTDMLTEKGEDNKYKNSGITVENPNIYLGKYVSYDVENDNRFSHDDVTKKYKYGSFYMVPNADDNTSYNNNSDENLNRFFGLMFEYYMDKWKQYCWKCGEKINSSDITEVSTGRMTKYHITCHNCNNFTVKNHCMKCGATIIKHAENYFIEAGAKTEDEKQKKTLWLLRCPSCGDPSPGKTNKA